MALVCKQCTSVSRCQPYSNGLKHTRLRHTPKRAVQERAVLVTRAQQSDTQPSNFSSLRLWLLSLPAILAASPALGADIVQYNPQGGDEFIRNATGGGYVLLVAYFAYRVLTRRAARAKTERLGGTREEPKPVAPQSKAAANDGKATPLTAFLGAAQAGLLAFGLWIFTNKMQGVLDGSAVPDQYTARNITVTVRTILLGMSYLCTFIFTANCLGLTGLSLQMLIFPDTLKDDTPDPKDKPRGPQLPKVSVVSSSDDIKSAFDMAERAGKTEGGRE